MRFIMFFVLVFLVSIMPVTLLAGANWWVEPDNKWICYAKPGLAVDALQVLWFLVSWQLVKRFMGFSPSDKGGA